MQGERKKLGPTLGNRASKGGKDPEHGEKGVETFSTGATTMPMAREKKKTATARGIETGKGKKPPKREKKGKIEERKKYNDPTNTEQRVQPTAEKTKYRGVSRENF